MEPAAMLRSNAMGRVLLGGALLAAPGFAGRLWAGPGADGAGGRVFVRAVGARDLAIGAGALMALSSGGSLRNWALAGLVADVVDAAATIAARDQLPSGAVAGIGVLATAGAVQCALVAARAD